MPRIARGGGFEWTKVFMIVIFAVIGLYLMGQFSEAGADGREFVIPANIDKTVLMVFKILIVGAVTYGGYVIFMKLAGGALTKRDAFTLVLIGIGIILLWDKILQPILTERLSIDNITFSVGQKLGFFKP